MNIPSFALTLFLCLGAVAGRAQYADPGVPVARDFVVTQDMANHDPNVFHTIIEAIKAADQFRKQSGQGARVSIEPGLYREKIVLWPDKAGVTAPLVIEGKTPDGVVVTGSDAWNDGWDKRNQLYVHAWPYHCGLAPYPNGWEPYVNLKDIVRRREMIFVGGKNLRQVASPSEIKEGTFYVSEDKGLVQMWPPAGLTPANGVEVGVRSGIFMVPGRKNLVMRNLTFCHDTSPVQGGAVSVVNCSNVLIEYCHFDWNNWSGFGLYRCDNTTVRNTVANCNGGAGFGVSVSMNLDYEDSETSYNNWRGAAGGFTGWAVAGTKMCCIHGGLIRNHRAIGNQTRAFWFDSDTYNVTVENAFWEKNLTNGIFFECDAGPITLKDSVIAFNGQAGVQSTTSENITMENNLIVGNQTQIFLIGVEHRVDTNFETHANATLTMKNWTLRGNVIAGISPGQTLIDSMGWDRFLSTFHSSRNLWYNPVNKDCFRLAQMPLDFSAWQIVTGQDLDSKFMDPELKIAADGGTEVSPKSPWNQRGDWKPITVAAVGMEALKQSKIEETRRILADAYPLAQKTGPDSWTQVDLQPFVNRGFTGTNGWIGAGYPLATLSAGDHTYHGVPFHVVDEKQNGGLAAIAMKSAKMVLSNSKPLPEEVTIPVECKAQALYFLHGAAWTAESEPFADYAIVYEDGTTATVPLIPLGNPKDFDVMQKLENTATIQDWFGTGPEFSNTAARQVPLLREDDPLKSSHYLYTLEWANPKPRVPIKEVKITSDPAKGETLFVVALTVLKAP